MRKAEADQIFTEELYRLPGKVLVLIPKPWESYAPADVLLLSKILGSVKQSLDSVQVVCHGETDIESISIYGPSHVLSFGCSITPKSQPFTAEIIKGIHVVQSESLEMLDDAKKKSLWVALKQAFKL